METEPEPVFTIHPEPLGVYVRVTDTLFEFNGRNPDFSNSRVRDREIVRTLLKEALDQLDGF